MFLRTLIVLVGLSMALLFSVRMADAAFCTRTVDRTDDNAGATACTTADNDCSLRGGPERSRVRELHLRAGRYLLHQWH